MINRSVVMAVVLLLVSISLGCNWPQRHTSTVVTSAPALPKQINALDGEDNPYAGQYSEWDELTHQALKLAEEQGYLGEMKDYAKSKFHDERFHNLDVLIDSNGNLVPKLLMARMKQDYFAAGTRERNLKPFSGFLRVPVPVVINEADYSRYRKALDEISASYWQPIPSWLGENPPGGGAILYPNGDVVCYGPLGSFKEHSSQGKAVTHDSHEHAPEQSSDSFGSMAATHHMKHYGDLYLYGRNGELKATSKGIHSPLTMYVESAEGGMGKEAEKYWGRADFRFTRDGYLFATEKSSGELLLVVDYDGTKYEGSGEPPLRRLQDFMVLTPDQLQRFYEAQKQ